MKLLKEYHYLLMRREGRIVLGPNAANLWLLVAVILTTFLAISFSAGSMAYLKEKMNDPFTSWVNINLNKGKNLDILKRSLDSDTMRAYFGFDGYQREVLSSFRCCYKDKEEWQVFSTLYFEKMRSDFVAAVLSEGNVIDGLSIIPDSIAENSIGVIITLEHLEELGYDRNHVPSFIDQPTFSPGAEDFGVSLINNEYARAPMPLLAVVKRLPMNKDMMASRYLNNLITGGYYPFALNNRDYATNLDFFVPIEVDNFTEDTILTLLDDSLHRYVKEVLLCSDKYQDMLRSWRKGKVWRVYLIDASVPITAVNRIEHSLTEGFKEQGVVRVYSYETDKKEEKNEDENSSARTDDDIISVHFNRLDSIRAFEHFVKDKTALQIEMTQVNSKLNFSAVSTMANYLTIALLLFSIISISIFVVNMMQSYFQKVKRNLGTFKAFGISTNELIKVYITIIIGIVLLALGIALAFVWLIELLLPLLGCLKDGEFSYLILWNMKTLWAIIIILVSTGVTVFWVMRNQLRRTPGDLVYDR